MAAAVLPKVKRSIDAFRMIPSDGGRFEVSIDGDRVYSKLETGEFPDMARVADEIASRCGV